MGKWVCNLRFSEPGRNYLLETHVELRHRFDVGSSHMNDAYSEEHPPLGSDNSLASETGSGISGTARNRAVNDDLFMLMEYCAKGDEQAFADLYNKTRALMFSTAMRMVRRREWAEDIIQESYLKIWVYAQDYRPDRGSPITWMISIVRHHALDCLRRRNPEQRSDDYVELAEKIPDDGAGPDVILETNRNARALLRCLTNLSSEQRQVLTLSYVHGLSHGELARHLDQPLGTVKSWVRRALKELKGEMTRGRVDHVLRYER